VAFGDGCNIIPLGSVSFQIWTQVTIVARWPKNSKGMEKTWKNVPISICV